MKTNAPGEFGCETYLKSWELNFRTGSTKEHIDNCPFCYPVVYGGTEDFPLSIEDKAKRNMKTKKEVNRRQFFRQIAVAAGVIGVSAVGFNHFASSESVALTNVAAKITSDFSRLDAFYATMGRPRIEARVANGTVAKSTHALQWIEARGHTQMYDLICTSLADRRTELSWVSLHLLTKIGPLALKPNLVLLNQIVPQIRDEELREFAINLVVEVESK
ncbi:MAG: hypothetical protein ACI97A_001661 [Planctomycetota bacterium]|jgi:hypothetical protein